MKFSKYKEQEKHTTTLYSIDVAEAEAIDDMVRAFSEEVRLKLQEKRNLGRRGWDHESWTPEQIKQALFDHVEKGDMRDVAAFAMFLWNREAQS